MRKKTTLNRGIAILALSASMFLGCQDFLSEDKAVHSAKTSSEENTRPDIQEPSTQASQDKDGIEPAQDLPAFTADTAKPAATEPTTPTVVPDNAAECKEIYAQMQTAKDPLYGELKNRFGELKCDITKYTPPYVPPDSATVCKNLRSTLAMLDPSSPKYPGYVSDIAIHCTDANTPTVPAAPPSTPAAGSDFPADCKGILAEMQTAQEPRYSELKLRFSEQKCDFSSVPYVPPVPPDSATVCNNLKSTLATLDPNGTKYPLYLEQIAIYCTAKTTETSKPAAPAPPSTPVASDNLAECKLIYAEMHTVKDPLYGELKNKFGELKCDHALVANSYVPPVPPVPPDSATVCNNLRSTLAMLDPSSPKYPGYVSEIEIHCTPKP